MTCSLFLRFLRSSVFQGFAFPIAAILSSAFLFTQLPNSPFDRSPCSLFLRFLRSSVFQRFCFSDRGDHAPFAGPSFIYSITKLSRWAPALMSDLSSSASSIPPCFKGLLFRSRRFSRPPFFLPNY